MIARLGGEESWVGPVFVPGEPPCWHCLAIRLREHRWVESQLLGNTPEGRVRPYSTDNRMRAAAEFAAQETARWLLEAKNSLEGTIWSFSWATLLSQRHVVSKQAGCPLCGDPIGGGRQVIRLASSVVRWDYSCELRALSPGRPE